ncbi:MAG: DUF3667 domain-containing protein [Flavobacteriaceae bacterium]|nr:DUF3667 domain-containing protein [Flavobacteriaceae bacterium]RZV64334.1 MAG: DUF3667 domain-containing protein [Flavobacteriaceae bacterium]
MNQSTETCKNCEQEFDEGFKFCPNCGQQTKDDLTIGLLFYNTIANYFSFDARFLKSFFPLLFKPGSLAKRFIEGKRLLYLHPAQLYLFISVIFFFLNSFGVRKRAQEWNESLAKTLIKETDTITDQRVKDSILLAKALKKERADSIAKAETRKALMTTSRFTKMTEAEIDSIIASDAFKTKDSDGLNWSFDEMKIDSLLTAGATDEDIYKAMGMDEDAGFFAKRFFSQVLKFYKNRQGGSLYQAFFDTIPIAMFFLLPIFALFLKIFYWRRGRYAHHLVFAFYYFSFLFTVLSIVIGVNMIWDIPDWIDWLIGFSTIFYMFLALKRFYEQGWILSFFKTGFIAFGFMLFVLPLTAGIVALFAFMFY